MTFQRSKWILAASLVASTAACSSAPKPEPVAQNVAPKPKVKTPEEHLSEAQAALASENYAAALAGYDAVLARDPDNADVLYNKAYALHRSGQLDEAAAVYARVLEIDPTSTDAAVNLGAILREQGKLDRAIEVTNAALEHDEFNGRLLNNLSVLYRAKGRYDDAVAAVRKLLMRDKKNVDAYKNLSLIYYEQKKYELSRTILENALKMAKEQDREDADIYVNLGMLYLAKKENGKAMAAFKKATAIDPDHPVANYNIGSLALGHRDYGLAVESYQTVSKAWKDNYDVVVGHGFALQGQASLQQNPELFAEAATVLERARTLLAGLPESRPDEEQAILKELAVIYQNSEQYEKALEAARAYAESAGLSCSEDDYEGFCGRLNGIKLTIQMANEAAAEPEEEKPQAEAKDISEVGESTVFTDEGIEEEEEGTEDAAEGGEMPAEGADGGDAPAEGAEAVPEEASTPES